MGAQGNQGFVRSALPAVWVGTSLLAVATAFVALDNTFQEPFMVVRTWDIAVQVVFATVFGSTLAGLVDGVILSAVVTGKVHDLRLETTKGTLFIFCDHVPPQMSFNGNWELTLPGGCIAFGPGTIVEWEVMKDR